MAIMLAAIIQQVTAQAGTKDRQTWSLWVVELGDGRRCGIVAACAHAVCACK